MQSHVTNLYESTAYRHASHISSLLYVCVCVCACVHACVCGSLSTEAMQQMQLQLAESERRANNSTRWLGKVHGDYRNLIGITAELVDSLEATASGKMVGHVFFLSWLLLQSV